MKTRAVVICIALLAPLARPAAAAPRDTIAVLTTLSSRPVLALAPGTGIPHVAYLSAGTLYHAWKTSGAWNIEVVSDSVQFSSTFGGFELAVAADGHPTAVFVRNGTLFAALRGESGWSRDALDALAGPTYPVAIAISPTTNEPAVVWAKAGTPSVVNYALHQGIGWSIQQVDTTSASFLAVALAMDGSGRPRIAWSRPRTDNLTGIRVLTCAIAASALGPFLGETIDTEFSQFVSIVADPLSGEPRLVYSAFNMSNQGTHRYTFHDGTWQTMVALNANTSPPTPASLALDPVGNPWITHTVYSPIEPGIPQSPQDCGFIQTGDIYVYTRTGGAGMGPFQLAAYFTGPLYGDAVSGVRASGSSATGIADIAWRSPSTNGCSQYAVSYIRTSTAVGVGDPTAVRVALAPIAPNPARSGDPLHIAFGLDRSAAVALELHDLAGRRIAARAAERLDPGAQAIEWAPGSLRAGLYWLTVRVDGTRLGTRSLVVLR